MGLERIVLPMGVVLALGVPAIISAQQSQEPVRQEQEAITPASELTVEKAEYIMQHCANEEEIIQWYGLDSIIKRVTYNPETRRNNFEELVMRSEKPGIVLFYGRDERTSSRGINGSKRATVLFCEATHKYSTIINFVMFESNTDPQLSSNGYSGIVREFGIKATPSMAMYARCDRLLGETPENCPSQVKQIDVLRGAPAEDSALPEWFYGELSLTDWISSNLIPSDEQNYIVRVKNSSNPERVLLQSRR